MEERANRDGADDGAGAVTAVAAVLAFIVRGERAVAATLTPFDLTPPQLVVLAGLVSTTEGWSMSRLATSGGHSLATMTGIVDRLVQAGLVERGERAGDRRVVLVRLTAAGRDRQQAALAALTAQVERALGVLAAPERAGFAATIGRVVEALVAAAGPTPSGR
jgi:DNA-binding MarR family transcriptional regulator